MRLRPILLSLAVTCGLASAAGFGLSAAAQTQPAAQAGEVRSQAVGERPAAAPPPRAPERPAVPSADVVELRRGLDAARAELDQATTALRREGVTGDELQRLRAVMDPLVEKLREQIALVEPQLDAARARLEQLGPRPKAGEPAEGADVARDRAEREAAVAELDETARLARALLLQTEQGISQISERRRAAFNRSLFARTHSIFDPSLWSGAAASFPRDLRAAEVVFGDLTRRIEYWATPASLALLGLALGIAIALHLVRRRLAPRLVERERQEREPSRRRMLMTAGALLLVETLPALVGVVGIYGVLEAAELIPFRLDSVAETVAGAVVGVVFLRGLAEAVLAPGRQGWALVVLPETVAVRAKLFVTLLAATAATGQVVASVNAAIAAGLSLSIATRASFAAISALILAEWMRQLVRAKSAEEACLGPYIPSEAEAGGPARMVGWAAVIVVVASLLAGYIAFASFVIDQILWMGVVAALLYFAVALSDEFVGRSLSGETRISTTLQANTGLRRRSLEQLGVLASGIARVLLGVAALMLVLVPWGVESGDIWSNLRSAFFGFKVGDVTVSISTLFVGLLLFGLIFATTRIVQGWLDKTFLPTTDMDAGLRNSISTAVGYVGFFLAAAISFSYLGFSLDKIAIVAGALSVGIGFGLQSIVNNFVSGLILLWERPIRVGDLVVIGDGEGYVRKISVRATEIDTFDRSTVIVPNSNLISGVVKNRVRADRTGRVVLPIKVVRSQDPARAASLLVACAAEHPAVLREPPPRVVFRQIGETFLDFELVAYVDDVGRQLAVQSDLNFAVFKSLVGEGIIPPLGTGSVNVGGLEPVGDALARIAAAIATHERTVAGSAGPPAPEPASRPERLRAAGG